MIFKICPRREKCMKKTKYIDQVRVETPCSERWEEMIGNDQVRFCSHCAKDVNNISALTRKEAMRLVVKHNGRLCVRYRTEPRTNRPIFLDTLTKITRRSPAMTAGVMATSFAVATAAYAQSEPQPIPQNQSQIVLNKTDGDTSAVSGYVTDPNGAAVPFAVVTLVNEKTFEYRAANASLEGFYEFKDVPPGDYTIKFEGGGFEAKETKNLSLSGGGDLRRDAQLSLQSVAETVEVSADLPESGSATMGVVGMVLSIESSNPLVHAAMNDDLGEVKARVMMHAKVNVRDKGYDGMSPLHAAVQNGNIEMIQFLLDSGAKTNFRDSQRRTPLLMMDGDATPEIFDLLIRFGAKPQLIDKEKNTALHHFVENADDDEIVRLLVTHGVNVNAVNREGETALMVAAENGNSGDIKALIESGADLNKTDLDGKTAWELTRDTEIRSLLESYGAIAKADRQN
jgi:hypothetical protein